jgi:hypothetical protein
VAVVHQQRSLKAARIIAADPERYGGLDVGLVAWAERVLATTAVNEDVESAATADDGDQGPPQLRLPYSEAKRED